MGMSGQCHADAFHIWGKNCWYSLYTRLDGLHNQSAEARRKIFCPAKDQILVIQSVARHYID
jgi:hypothetical protein